MSFGPREYLLHIGEEVEYLLAESKGMTFADFEASPTKQRPSFEASRSSAKRSRSSRPTFWPRSRRSRGTRSLDCGIG
jgi:hypothetical protein